MSNDIKLTIFNSGGLRKQIIDSILQETQDTHLLFINETWLLSPNRFPTSWIQHNVHGIKHPNCYHGSQGLSLLINPSCPYYVHPLNTSDSPYSTFHLSCIVAKTLIYCVYLPPPPKTSDDFALEVLTSLPLQLPNINNTSICGDSNNNTRKQPFLEWERTNNLTLWNSKLAYGQATFLNHNGTSIIDFFLSTRHCPNASINIRNDISLDSFYKMVHFSFQLPDAITIQSPIQGHRKLWRLSKFQDQEKRQQYIVIFINNTQALENDLTKQLSLPAPQLVRRIFITYYIYCKQ